MDRKDRFQKEINGFLQTFFKGNCSNAFWTAAVLFALLGGLTGGVIAGNLMAVGGG